MFINFSNHNSALWSEKQLAAAKIYGEIKDIPFPNIDPSADEQHILEAAETCVEEISAMKPSAVLVQGEMTFCYAVVSVLKKKGIRTCLHKHMRTSFRQILPQTALKILARRQPACGFLPCLQQNYARKSAHISYEDRF